MARSVATGREREETADRDTADEAATPALAVEGLSKQFGSGDSAVLAGGYVVFHYATRRARRLGVLGDY